LKDTLNCGIIFFEHKKGGLPMVNKQENELVFTKLQDAINSSFILFETKLEGVLYSLATSPIVYSIVERCVKNYDYISAKQKYLISPNFERNGAFVSPQDRREFIAFSTNLLYEIFDKKILFTDLLDLYFSGNGYKEKFDDFKNKVLIVLYQHLNSVFEEMQYLYSQKIEQENAKNQEVICNKEQLKLYTNNLKIKTEDRVYFDYFIDKIINENSVEICLKAIEYILLNYKKGEEILQELMEIISKI